MLTDVSEHPSQLKRPSGALWKVYGIILQGLGSLKTKKVTEILKSLCNLF